AERASGIHFLCLTREEQKVLSEHGYMPRITHQYHWQNRGFNSFDDYLAPLRSQRRKEIKRERRKAAELGLTIETLTGDAIREGHMRAMYGFYVQTYARKWGSPYLNLAFFRLIGDSLAEHLVLFLAYRDGEPLAASLCLKDGRQLYGRYWGALEDVSCLHFELCYYQGIAYCIRHGLAVFEGGAQGEHKLARGFEPVMTCSAHWLADSPFQSAICRWIEQERRAVAAYIDELGQHIAYKK
ncbi:MAG: GNAT family N-acetyltransferase, partial [Pseudogulbenkiania sp.]|nr:GNAT family N-acetyltransferase [Pseudogulbenkiania sp.]